MRVKISNGVWIGALGACMVGALSFSLVFTSHATGSRSPSYEMIESKFGTSQGGNGCSDQYCSEIGTTPTDQQSTGSDDSSSKKEAKLDVTIANGTSQLAILSPRKTGTKTMSITVKNAGAPGYTVQLFGEEPRYGKYALKSSQTPAPSRVGQEQFGINLVKNEVPKVGQLPSFQRDTTLTKAYAKANYFSYKSGDIVAKSYAKNSTIRYTVSMIVNISQTTPPGNYVGNYAAIVTPIY